VLITQGSVVRVHAGPPIVKQKQAEFANADDGSKPRP